MEPSHPIECSSVVDRGELDDGRTWQVLLIGGASGVGKTHISYRLSQHFGVGITEIDDFQVILKRMTIPEQYPDLHRFRTPPDVIRRMDEERNPAHSVEYANVMSEPLEFDIANHVDGRPPFVREVAFLISALVAQATYDGVPADGRARAVFASERDEEQIERNFHAREGEPQPLRAAASWRYNEWLRQDVDSGELPTVEARPWEAECEPTLKIPGPVADQEAVETLHA